MNFRYREFIILGVIIVVVFFFWNVSLFSDQLCQRELNSEREDRYKTTSSLRNQLQSLEVERNKLQETIEQYELKFIEKTQKLDEYIKNVDGVKNQLQLPKPTEGRGEHTRIGLIVFTYNRPDYLRRTLTKLIEYLPSNIPVVVSQDGDAADIKSVTKQFPRILHIQNSPREKPKKRSLSEPDSYYYISMHYKFGLTQMFDNLLFDAVIIIEDDMEISPDFFSYFETMYNKLKEDKTLYCVSAWNDNGQQQFVKESEVVFRSNFFPGLGWMLTKELWKEELSSKWPDGYWDDWLREPQQRKGRDCIRPEVSRTFTFGREGSSMGQFYDQYLANIKLNQINIDWSLKDLSFLDKDKFDSYINKMVNDATKIDSVYQLNEYKDKSTSLRISYSSENEFKTIADHVGIMNDFKAGVPRTAYNGIVTFWHNSNRVFVTPK